MIQHHPQLLPVTIPGLGDFTFHPLNEMIRQAVCEVAKQWGATNDVESGVTNAVTFALASLAVRAVTSPAHWGLKGLIDRSHEEAACLELFGIWAALNTADVALEGARPQSVTLH